MAARAWRLTATGMAAAVCGVAVLLWIFRPPHVPVEQAQYRAERSGQRDLELADHSRVELASDSVLSSQYSATRRLLKLERGEAYFEVEEDRSRPFVVDAGLVVVTATGTAFNVRRTSGRAVVSVTEGAVDVAPSAGSTSAPLLRVQAGQEVVCSDSPGGPVFAVRFALTAVMGRQRDFLRYQDEPLGSVVEDINRYLPNPVVVTDEKLRELAFTGTVNPERAELWVLALERILPVSASRRADGSILLEARPSVAR